MARIKFLDILEETKSKPSYRGNVVEEQASKPIEEGRRSSRSERSYREENIEKSARISRHSELDHNREQVIPNRDLAMDFETGYTGRRKMTDATSKSTSSLLGLEENKSLLTGALFVLFGGVLFFSGYWLGKTVTDKVKTEREMLVSQNFQNFQDLKKEEVNNGTPLLSNTVQPIATTLENKNIPVIEPAFVPATPKPKPAPKPVAPKKEYIIQISAHSTIDSARLIEDRLRSEGFTAYTSESAIGDAVFFRVRLRGFTTKKAAQDALAKIKATGIGTDGFVLTLE